MKRRVPHATGRAGGIQKSFVDTTGKRRRAKKIVIEKIAAVLSDGRSRDGIQAFNIEPVRVLEHGATAARLLEEMSFDIRKAELVLEDGTKLTVGASRSDDENASLYDLLPPGIHALNLTLGSDGNSFQRQTVIVAPPKCHELHRGDRARILAVQLYAISSRRNWGIGDFRDLQGTIEAAAAAGYRYIALNPLHRLTYATGGCVSPYSPSSRFLLNWIYLDIESVPGYGELVKKNPERFGAAFESELALLRKAPWVDYAAVAWIKRTVLLELSKMAMAWVRPVKSTNDAAVGDYVRFRETNHSQIMAYTQARLREGEHIEIEAEFDIFTEWCCRRQLEGCASNIAGVGLFLDIAIGTSPDDAEVRSSPQDYAKGVSIGAPPDSFNEKGQNWNLAPFDPETLRTTAYSVFVRLLDANMLAGGGVRIDHVMWLCRQYWILNGCDAGDGAYVNFPEAELLALVRVMSSRKKCIVLGEDLGTVPLGFRTRLRAVGIYTMHIVRFEREKNGAFRSFKKFEPRSALFISTHDLAPIAAYVAGADIVLALSLGLTTPRVASVGQKRRQAEIAEFFKHAGVCERFRRDAPGPDLFLEVARTMAERSSCQLLVDSADDLLLQTTPVNIPGTTFEYPNWRRKYCREIDAAVLTGLTTQAFEPTVKAAKQARKRRH